MKNAKRYIILFVIIVLATIGLFFLDYLNIFHKCSVNVSNVNMNFWNIFINGFIVVTLYIITYLVIDKRHIKQLDNKRNIAKLLLSETYKDCLTDIDWMDKKDYRIHVASRIDFNDYLNNNPAFQKIVESPFYNHDIILSFAKEGIISSQHLESYLNVRKEFRLFLTMSITFFDEYELATEQKEKLRKIIDDALHNVEDLK